MLPTIEHMTQPNRNVGDGSAAEFFIPFKKGSNLVASVEENLIIKIFPPFLNFQWESERLSLQQLWRKVETQTPEFLFQGEKDSWLYLIFSKLEGISFEQVWPIASEEEKTSILSQIGQLIGQLHQVPVGTLIQLEPKWEKFVLEQKQSCYSCHKNLNLPQHFTLEIDRYLTSVERYLPKHFNSCILTGEYTPENIILQRTDFK